MLVEIPEAVGALVGVALDRISAKNIAECTAFGAGIIASGEKAGDKRTVVGGFESTSGQLFLVYIEKATEQEVEQACRVPDKEVMNMKKLVEMGNQIMYKL